MMAGINDTSLLLLYFSGALYHIEYITQGAINLVKMLKKNTK